MLSAAALRLLVAYLALTESSLALAKARIKLGA